MKKAIKLFILIIAVTFPMQTNAFKGNYESSVGLPLQLNTTLEFNFNHMNYSLLSEFVNPNLALKEFNTTHLDFYNNIYSKIGSMELTSKSIEKFKLEINNLYISDSNLYIEYESDIEDFKSFLDIYENTIINNKIYEYLSSEKLAENIIYIYQNLPFEEAMNFQKNNPNLFLNMQNISIEAVKNISAGVTYAQTYAIWQNTIDKYYYFGGTDCTNFGSQIMEAMGILQNYPGTNNGNVGWWHKITKTYNPYTLGYDYTHAHSSSFINTNSFALYFGVYNTYTSFLTFSQNVRVGDFILIDEAKDGDWDHLGFVTAISTNSNSYTDQYGVTRTYYNFKVAQHSNNYHQYVNSNSNGWEQNNTTRTYAIITR